MAYTKLTNEQIQKIVADYVNTNNYCETARMNGVTEACVRKVVKNFGDVEIKKLFEQKKQENTQTTIEYMQTQHETKKRILDKILKAIETKADNVDDMFTNIKDLATAYGIILDKELKVIELQRNTVSNDDLLKVQELLSKIEDEAKK